MTPDPAFPIIQQHTSKAIKHIMFSLILSMTITLTFMCKKEVAKSLADPAGFKLNRHQTAIKSSLTPAVQSSCITSEITCCSVFYVSISSFNCTPQLSFLPLSNLETSL